MNAACLAYPPVPPEYIEWVKQRVRPGILLCRSLPTLAPPSVCSHKGGGPLLLTFSAACLCARANPRAIYLVVQCPAFNAVNGPINMRPAQGTVSSDALLGAALSSLRSPYVYISTTPKAGIKVYGRLCAHPNPIYMGDPYSSLCPLLGGLSGSLPSTLNGAWLAIANPAAGRECFNPARRAGCFSFFFVPVVPVTIPTTPLCELSAA